VRHFAGFWEFASRPSLCETPPERQAPDTLSAIWADSVTESVVDNKLDKKKFWIFRLAEKKFGLSLRV